MQLPFYCGYQLLHFQKHTIAEYFILFDLITLAGFNERIGGCDGEIATF